MSTHLPLLGQVGLVTGGASGIGRATGLALAREGVAVALIDVDGAAAAQAAAQLTAEGATAVAVQADLADPARSREVVPDVVATLGRLDILVNCAAIHPLGTTLFDLPEEVWDHVQAVNLKAPFLLVQAFARHAAERGGGGRIVNVSSTGAFRLGVNAAYASTKAGLGGLTRSAAGELAPLDITVNAVAPGITRTQMALQVFGSEEELERLTREGAAANLFKRPSEPDEVAAAIVFLCLPSSRQITGQVLHISGGVVA